MLPRRRIARKLLFEPWRWFVLTVLWTLFTHAAAIRDNFLPVEWRATPQVLDYLPTWPWWVWSSGSYY